MLRSLLVFGAIIVGLRYSLKDPFYALLFYLWFAYFRPQEWLWSDFLSSLAPSMLVGVRALVGTVLRGRFSVSGAGWFLLLFLLHGFVSVLASTVPGSAWPYWVDFAKVCVMGLLMLSLITTEWHLRTTMLTIAASLGFEGAKQGLVEFVRHPGASNMNPWPMLGDNNGVAVGMLMLTAITIALSRTATNVWERRTAGVMAFGVLYRGLSTYSRGGFLASAVLLMHFLMRARRRVVAMLAAAVAAVIIVNVLPDAFWERMDTIPSVGATRETDDQSILGRLHFWSVAADMAADRPLTGVGLNAYNFVYDNYDTSHGAFGRGRSVHSSWFGILAELGYPGILLFIGLCVGALLTTLGVRRRARRDPRLTTLADLAAGLEGALLVFLVGGAFVPMQYNEMAWHVIVLCFVTGRVAARISARPPADPPVPVPAAAAPARAVPPRVAARVPLARRSGR